MRVKHKYRTVSSQEEVDDLIQRWVNEEIDADTIDNYFGSVSCKVLANKIYEMADNPLLDKAERELKFFREGIAVGIFLSKVGLVRK